MKRDLRLDFIRGVAIILIVFSHVLQRGMEGYDLEPISTLLFLLAMPAFFFVSGINLGRRKALKPLGFLVDVLKRGITYLWPAILFLLLRTYIYGQWADFPAAWSAYMDNVQVGLWVLWVLALMNGCVDVGMLLANITPKHPKIYGGIMLLAGYVTLIILRFNNVLLTDTFIGYDVLLLFIPITIFGYFCGERFLGLCRGIFALCWFVVGFGIVMFFGLNCAPYYHSPIEERQFIVYFGSIFPIMALGGLAGLFADKRWLRPVCTAGRYSLEIYLAHLLLIKVWPNLMADGPVVTGFRIAAITIGLLAFAEAVMQVTLSVPFLHFLAFGRIGTSNYDRKVDQTIRDFCLTH